MQTPPFKIEYLNKLYISRMEQLGVLLESTQPVKRLYVEHKKGKDIQIVHWQWSG